MEERSTEERLGRVVKRRPRSVGGSPDEAREREVILSGLGKHESRVASSVLVVSGGITRLVPTFDRTD
jgi:hypothetical protein